MYMKIMLPYVPWHLAMAHLSGAAEILGEIGLVVTPVRRSAALGLVALALILCEAGGWLPSEQHSGFDLDHLAVPLVRLKPPLEESIGDGLGLIGE